MLNLAAVGTKLLLPLCLAELAQNCRIRAGGNERPQAIAVKQPGLQWALALDPSELGKLCVYPNSPAQSRMETAGAQFYIEKVQ